MRGVGWLALAAASCGRIHFDPLGTGGDGGGGSSDGSTQTPADVAPPADIVAASACGGTVLFTDGFDDGTPGPTFGVTTSPGMSSIESASAVVFVFQAAGVAGGRAAYYRSLNSYTTEGLCATAEIQTTADPAGPDAAIYLSLRTAAQEVQFREHGGSLELVTRSNTTVTVLAFVPWDAAQDRFVRLRQLGGVTYWDTSPDGSAFAQRLSQPGFPTASCQVELGAIALNAVASGSGGDAAFASASLFGP